MTLIRNAAAQDAAAIAAIYNDAVAHGTAIWNDVLVDEANRRDWIAARQEQGYVVLVAELEGKIAGYASFGAFRAFDGFRASVEHSVYVDAPFRGRGIARDLMRQLIAEARDRGFHLMIGAIEAGNAPSIALHHALGFGNSHVMREVGQKFGRWLDLCLMELRLDNRPVPEPGQPAL